MKVYAATIVLKGIGQQHVAIHADDGFKAKAMLEAQYGSGNVLAVHAASGSDLKRAGWSRP